MHDTQRTTFMIQLDALFDTRIGTCKRITPQLSRTLLKDPKYPKREHDFFAKTSIYQSLWRSRNVDTLKASPSTPVLNLLGQLIKNEVGEHAYGLADHELVIYLNTYPYNLNDSIKEMLTNVIYCFFPQLAKDCCKFVHISNALLTPAYLVGSDVNAYIAYDWQDWLELHGAALEEKPAPSLHLIGPRLRKYDIDFQVGEDTSIAQDLLNKGALWEITEMNCQFSIGLRLMPVGFFSAVICKA